MICRIVLRNAWETGLFVVPGIIFDGKIRIFFSKTADCVSSETNF